MLQSSRPLLELGTDHRNIPELHMPFLENQSADVYIMILESLLRNINKIATKIKCPMESNHFISKTLKP